MAITLQPIEIANIAALDMDEATMHTFENYFDYTKPVLTVALEVLRTRRVLYQYYVNYYEGDHLQLFSTTKFNEAFGNLFQTLRDNLMPRVVEAFNDRLIVTGFNVEEGEANTSDKVWRLWEDNRMDQRAPETHQEAMRCGDAYVLVWPDAEGRPRIYPQRADLCLVRYSEEIPGDVMWGVKLWHNDQNFVRANVYYPDRIEKYISRNKAKYYDLTQQANSFTQFQAPGESWPMDNPYGQVPIFHFANNSGLGQYGNSELKNLIPLQDALNKALADMLVAEEFGAYQQRWATGIEVMRDEKGKEIAPFKPGIDRLWASASEEAKFGQFDATQLKQYLDVQDSLRAEIARVSGVPLHFLMMNQGSFPSGEALRIAEAPLVSKVKKKQTAWGNVWENVMKFALLVQGTSGDAMLSTQWTPAASYSESEELANLLVKQQLGVSTEKLLEEAGYGQKEIDEMMQQKADAATVTANDAINAFNKGDLTGN